jgi:hypothetical protein
MREREYVITTAHTRIHCTIHAYALPIYLSLRERKAPLGWQSCEGARECDEVADHEDGLLLNLVFVGDDDSLLLGVLGAAASVLNAEGHAVGVVVFPVQSFHMMCRVDFSTFPSLWCRIIPSP